MSHKTTIYDGVAHCYLCGLTYDDGADAAGLPPCLPDAPVRGGLITGVAYRIRQRERERQQ